MQFVAPFVLPPQNIVHSGSVARTPHEKEAEGAGDAVMTAAGRKEGRGKGASFNITKANFLSLPKRSATVRRTEGTLASVGKRWEGRNGRWMEWGMGQTNGRIDGKSLCPVAFPGRRRRTRIKKMLCANLFPFSRPSEQRRVRRGTESVSNGASSNLGESSSS